MGRARSRRRARVDAGNSDLSFSAPFLQINSLFSTTRQVLAIANVLLILPLPDHPRSAKIALPCRLRFVGAGIVVWNQGGCPPSWMLAGPSRGTLTDPTIMKKLLPAAILALIVSGVMTSESFAWGCCFGLIPHRGCCGCCGCGAQFCVRQYNAFSPVCCGTVFCDGCCPFGAGGGGYGGCGMGAMGGMMPFAGTMGGCCGPGGCGNGAYLGSLPPADAAAGAAVAPSAPADPLPSGTTSQLVNDRPIQNATYSSANYTPARTVTPVKMQPQLMAAPSYWGN